MPNRFNRAGQVKEFDGGLNHFVDYSILERRVVLKDTLISS